MKSLMVIAAVLWSTAASAQYWRALGRGTVGPTEVQTLYGDSVSNKLLAGGTFRHILNTTDTVLAYGQAAWNGTRWDSLATRVQPDGGGELVQQTYWFLRFQNRLYSCGGFGFFDSSGQVNRGLARLDETTHQWEALECLNPNFGGMETLEPRDPQNTLYATGYMGTVCGYPQSCVFRYDGSAFHIWEPFNQIPQGLNDAYVGTVFDFQGKTYMTCSLPDPDGSGFVSFIRWNGNSWEHVPGWNTLSPIKDISIHNDTLYVAGTFSLADGGPGNLVAAFDGENWSDMGGGLSYPPVPMSGAVLDLEWFHDDLLACGRFIKAGNTDCTGIAKWDGHQWCSFAGAIHDEFGNNARITDMAIWRDSLYICGGINSIDGEPMYQVAQWIGGDATGDCSTVGINEVRTHNSTLSVSPLDEPGRWNVQFPKAGNWNVIAYDALGRPVGNWHVNGGQLDIDLGSQIQGLYVLRASLPSGEVGSAKIIQP